MTTFIRTTSHNPDFQTLVALLDADLKIRDGEEHALLNAIMELFISLKRITMTRL